MMLLRSISLVALIAFVFGQAAFAAPRKASKSLFEFDDEFSPSRAAHGISPGQLEMGVGRAQAQIERQNAVSHLAGAVAAVPVEGDFITQTSDGVYEVTVDDFMKQGLAGLFTPEIKQKYDDQTLLNVDLYGIKQRVFEQLAGLYDFVVFFPSERMLSNTAYYGPSVDLGVMGLGNPEKANIGGLGFSGPDDTMVELQTDLLPLVLDRYSSFMLAAKEGTNRQGTAWVHLDQIQKLSGVFDAPSFERFVLLQELAHRWGITLSSGGDRKNPYGILSDDLAHWSAFFNAGSSPVRGIEWEDLGDGRFKMKKLWGWDTSNFDNFSSQFNDFDLYAMGFLAPEQVRSSFVIQNPSYLGRSLTENDLPALLGNAAFWINPVIEGARRDVTIQDIVNIEGARDPASSAAQKDFSAAFVILKDPADTAFALDSLRNKVSRIAQDLGAAWNAATRGLSRMTLGAAAGAFDFFKARILETFDLIVEALKTGKDLLGAQVSPARQADLDSEISKARKRLETLSQFEGRVGSLESILNPLLARAETNPNLRTALGDLPVRVRAIKDQTTAEKARLEAAVSNGMGVGSEIAAARDRTSSEAGLARPQGILPLGFARNVDARLNALDGRYQDLTSGLSSEIAHFDGVSDAIDAELTGLLNRLSVDWNFPEANIAINGGARWINQAEARINIAVTAPGASQMRFSEDGGNAWTDWESTAFSKPWTFSGADGQKEIVVEVRNAAGLISRVVASAILDRRPPSGNVLINDGDLFTDGNEITLKLNAQDANGVEAVRISSDGINFKESAIAGTEISETQNIALPDGEGDKAVYVQFKDRAGNWSEPVVSNVIRRGTLSQVPGRITGISGAIAGGVANGTIQVSVVSDREARVAYSLDSDDVVTARIAVGGGDFKSLPAAGVMMAEPPSPKNGYAMKIWDVGEAVFRDLTAVSLDGGSPVYTLHRNVPLAAGGASASWQKGAAGSIISTRSGTIGNSGLRPVRDGRIRSYNIYTKESSETEWRLAGQAVADLSGETVWRDAAVDVNAASRQYKVEIADASTFVYDGSPKNLGNPIQLALASPGLSPGSVSAQVRFTDSRQKTAVFPVKVGPTLDLYVFDLSGAGAAEGFDRSRIAFVDVSLSLGAGELPRSGEIVVRGRDLGL